MKLEDPKLVENYLNKIKKEKRLKMKKNALNNKIRREENSQKINDYKKSKGCLICGEKDFRCLDLHHKDKKKKKYTVNNIRSYNWEIIEGELKKCIVICANCHRKEHFEESQSIKK